jgi:hypothetical protein
MSYVSEEYDYRALKPRRQEVATAALDLDRVNSNDAMSNATTLLASIIINNCFGMFF